jgi:ParB family chromosome partitioning protein
MAKRRKLEAPKPEELAELEEGFAAKPLNPNEGLTAPIAQVAADAAGAGGALSADQRVAQAQAGVDAQSWRAAEAEGRVLKDIPLDDIDEGFLARDRVSMMRDELEELKFSLMANGQRLPIEVVPLVDEPGRYGLISGWRRYTVFRELRDGGTEGFETLKALVRPDSEAADAYTAMVEENEIRSSLSPFERGRIAVIAAGQGAFASPDEAVKVIFAAASKAKKSKIRSFALVHEELGDLLNFGEDLTERAGLRIANAIREGFAERLRAKLEMGNGDSAASEWAMMEEVLIEAEETATGPDRSNRSRKPAPRAQGGGAIDLGNGIQIERVKIKGGYAVQITGTIVDADMVDQIMVEVKRRLSPP